MCEKSVRERERESEGDERSQEIAKGEYQKRGALQFNLVRLQLLSVVRC